MGMGDNTSSSIGMNLSELEPALRMIGSAGSDNGLILCDAEKRVIYLNEHFEEISGIRAAESVGQDFASLARDQAFGALIKDLFERSLMGGSVSEDFEFSGNAYKISACAMGINQTQGYVFFVVKGGG
jgi:PAS domain S-box-containing protein